MLIAILNQTLAERCRKNPRYSLRAFARALEINSSTLSALLSGKRPMTVKTARRLIDRLELDAETRFEALRSVTGEKQAAASSDQPYLVLEQEAFEAIASWEHFALLALLDTKPKRADLRSLSARLAIPSGVASDSLQRLERLGMARRTPGGAWSSTGQPLTTSSDVPSMSVRKSNRQCIEKALESLENDPVDVRDITGITIAADSRKLPLAKALIQEFRRKLARLLESGQPNQVYRLNVQLFPMSQIRKEHS